MAARVTIADFQADEQGSSYADVLNDPAAAKALEVALEVMNTPAGLQRMKDAVDRHHNPPLVGVFKDIEATPEFHRATALPSKAFGRLKQAIGVGCKLTMARHHDYAPADLENGKPDQARVDSYSRWFVTARRYGPAARRVDVPVPALV